MGTSLVVQPFASLIDKVAETVPRLLLNRQIVSKYNPVLALMTGEATGFRFLDEVALGWKILLRVILAAGVVVVLVVDELVSLSRCCRISVDRRRRRRRWWWWWWSW